MIVRTLSEEKNGARRVVSEGWESVRLLLKDDNMGFSFHITTIYKNATLKLQYKNHLESVYCISGKGEVTSAETGMTSIIEPGTIYILDKHDSHVLRAETEMQMACVFNPPLYGKEVHDDSGSYRIDAEAGQ